MNMGDILQQIARIKDDDVLTIRPGPHTAAVSWHDGMAARVLLWLHDEMPDATVGDLESVLLSAMYWHMYLLTGQLAQDRQNAATEKRPIDT